MKLFIVLTSILAVAYAQRPWYAGSSPIGYPGLANRFKEEGDSTSTTPATNNRFDGPTDKIPIDARGDEDLVHRLNQWPRENRPFWVLNAEQIEAQRGTPIRQQPGGNNNNQPDLPSRLGGTEEGGNNKNNNNKNNYPDPALYYSFGYDDFGNPVFYHY